MTLISQVQNPLNQISSIKLFDFYDFWLWEKYAKKTWRHIRLKFGSQLWSCSWPSRSRHRTSSAFLIWPKWKISYGWKNVLWSFYVKLQTNPDQGGFSSWPEFWPLYFVWSFLDSSWNFCSRSCRGEIFTFPCLIFTNEDKQQQQQLLSLSPLGCWKLRVKERL